MACLLAGDNPLSKPMMVHCQLDTKQPISMKFCLKFPVFIQENAYENVVSKIAAILSWSQCVNYYNLWSH